MHDTVKAARRYVLAPPAAHHPHPQAALGARLRGRRPAPRLRAVASVPLEHARAQADGCGACTHHQACVAAEFCLEGNF